MTEIDTVELLEVKLINQISPFLLIKGFTSHLKKSNFESRFIINVTSSEGQFSYTNKTQYHLHTNMTKAALNMCLKNLSIEWRRQLPNVCVASLHPGTTDTGLSKPFQKNVPASSLFDSSYTATRLIEILSSLSPEQSGGFWSWDGKELPW